MKQISTFTFLLLLTIPLLVEGGQPQTKITGMFSTYEYLEDAGDISGLEVFIVVTNKGYHAVIQDSLGYPDVPVVVPVEVEGDWVRFGFSNSAGEEQSFEGRVTGKALSGKLNGEPYSLPRKKSYWQ